MPATQPSALVLRGHPALHAHADPVKDFLPLLALTQAMRQLMETHDGIGIAAPQVGESLRLFLVAKELFPPEVQNKLLSDVFVNAKIVRRSFKRIKDEEGCLSVPGVYGAVARPERITMESQTLSGKKFRIAASGLLARVLQHELDHLDGTLFIDKAVRETLHELLPDGTLQPWNP